MESKLKSPEGTAATAPIQGIPLATVQPGTTVHVSAVGAGYGLKSRLTSMGLIPGNDIKVVRNSSNGPLLVEVMGCRLMLGRGMALKIMVE
jgi:ferrous iron transport protein A